MKLLIDLLQESLVLFHSICPNWAAAIVLLTLTIRLVLFPLQFIVARQNARLKAVKPELDRLLAELKDDMPTYFRESALVKRRAGVSTPLLFISTLIQIPVFLSMYQAIRFGSFLAGATLAWVPSLGLADPFYILPVLVAGMYWLQARRAPRASVQMPRWVFPLVNFAFMAAMPAGVVLYSLANLVLQVLGERLIEQM